MLASIFSNLPGSYSLFDEINSPRSVSSKSTDDEVSYRQEVILTREIIPPVQCLEEYEREIEALYELKGHPNIVRLYGVMLRPLSIVLERMDFSLADYIAHVDWQVQ